MRLFLPLLISASLLIASCGGVDEEAKAANARQVQQAAQQALRPLYGDIARFCLAHTEGGNPEGGFLTDAGFDANRNLAGRTFERRWQAGKGAETATTGIRLRVRNGFPSNRGCSLDLIYSEDLNVVAIEDIGDMRAIWVQVLAQAGYEVSDPVQEDTLAPENTNISLSTQKTESQIGTKGDVEIEIATVRSKDEWQEILEKLTQIEVKFGEDEEEGEEP